MSSVVPCNSLPVVGCCVLAAQERVRRVPFLWSMVAASAGGQQEEWNGCRNRTEGKGGAPWVASASAVNQPSVLLPT